MPMRALFKRRIEHEQTSSGSAGEQLELTAVHRCFSMQTPPRLASDMTFHRSCVIAEPTCLPSCSLFCIAAAAYQEPHTYCFGVCVFIELFQ